MHNLAVSIYEELREVPLDRIPENAFSLRAQVLFLMAELVARERQYLQPACVAGKVNQKSSPLELSVVDSLAMEPGTTPLPRRSGSGRSPERKASFPAGRRKG